MTCVLPNRPLPLVPQSLKLPTSAPAGPLSRATSGLQLSVAETERPPEPVTTSSSIANLESTEPHLAVKTPTLSGNLTAIDMLTPGPALANAAVVRYAATTPPFSKNTAGVSLALSPADSCFIALHESLDPLGITVCDVSTFSATVKTGLTEFMGRACLLLDKLLNDDEHKQTFHFVLVEDLRVNACHSSQRDDSIVIGVTLGLIREIGSDEELAFVLAHELEHHHSQIEKDRREKMEARQTPRNDDLLDTIAWAFKRRSVEHECDVRAVKRLINKQISPQGGLRILSKVRARRLANNPTELPAEGHPLSMTRINAVGAILADSVRHQGQAQNYRLEQQTQTTEVLGNVHELLFKTDCLQNECFEKARAFINPDRVVDEAYQAIADNHKPETLSVEAAEHYEPASCFPEIFNYYWSRASRLLMPELPAEQRLDLQLQLVVNLDRAFKRAKQEILGDDFTVSEYWQYEMLLLLEKRTLDLDIPSIQLCLVQRAYCVEAIKKHGTIPDDTLSLETKQQNLARIERQLEIAKHVFEPGKKLEQYMAKGYTKEQLDVLLLDRRGRRFLDVELARHGLRIREVHDIIVGNKQQLEAIKRKNGFQVLLAATDIMHFIGLLNHYYSGFSRTGQQATNPSGNFIKVLHKAKALVDEALARCENGNLDKQTFEQIKTLISSISFHGDYSAPHTPEVFAHRQGFLDKAISILFSQKQLFSSTEELFNFECQIVSPSLAVLGPRGAVIKEEVQRLLVETAMTPIKQHIANGHIHEAMLALSDLTKQHKTLRTTILDSLDPVARTNINHHMLTLLKEWANAIGLTSDQLQTFVWITVPQFMPADVNSEQLAKAKADFHALCQNKNFTASLQGRCFHFWAVMHVFCNSGHAKAHLSEAYALAVMAQELWYSIDSLYYNVNFEQSLHDYLFKRLTVERPWDLKLAKILIQQVEQPTVSKSMPFLQACFRWYIDRFHGVTEATYQFWLAFDEAGISPLQDQLVLIECLINSFYTHAISPDADPSKHHLISLEFFEAYRAGVVRFAEQRQAEGGAKTTYYKTNYDEPHDQIPVKGGKALDMNLRISWQPLNDFWSEPDNYETLPIALVATAFEHWITEYGYHGINYLGHSGSQTSYHVLMFLFEHHRDHPDVRRVLLRAEMVKAAFFQSAKSRLVKWQLEQWPGFADFLPNLRAGKGRLPCKEELRPIISDIHEFLRIRFPEPCSASYEVVSFVERHLLTSKTETELLNQLRVTEQNWTSNPALYAPDAADFIAQALRTDQERMGTLRYLLGIDDDPPQLQCFSDRFAINTYSPHMVGELKKRVAHGNEFFKILCVQALLADRVNAIESQLYLECKTLIMGEATQHEALSVLFDEYMRVLPCSERKILLALAIAAYDPSTGDHVSFKRLLQAAGPLGAKMSQALVTSGAVTGSLRAELLTSFDDALPPTRKDIFDDLAKIFPDDNIVQSVGRLLGSGSLNYTVEALLRSPVEGVAQRVAVRIQKANVRGQIDNEYLVWSTVLNNLSGHGNAQVRRYVRLIRGLLRDAYDILGPSAAELDLEQETNTFIRAQAVYETDTPNKQTGYTTSVTQPLPALQQLVAPDFHKVVSVNALIDHVRPGTLTPEHKKQVALTIFDAETRAIESGSFDPDGHPGNWLILADRKHLVRTDYARFTHIFDPAHFSGGPSPLILFKILFRSLFNTGRSANKDLASFIVDKAAEIFDLTTLPADFADTLDQIINSPDMPAASEPIEKLFYIQNQLETIYAENGLDLEFSFRPIIALPIASFVRLNVYRSDLGDLEYFKQFMIFLCPTGHGFWGA